MALCVQPQGKEDSLGRCTHIVLNLSYCTYRLYDLGQVTTLRLFSSVKQGPDICPAACCQDQRRYAHKYLIWHHHQFTQCILVTLPLLLSSFQEDRRIEAAVHLLTGKTKAGKISYKENLS